MPIKKTYNQHKIKYFICFILLLNSCSLFAQIFDASQNPLRVKWREMASGGFRIIYPTELEKEAQRLGNTVSKIYPAIGADYQRSQTQFPIVLQNRGTGSNGFVQLAPRKSQFYTTPAQQFDSEEPLNNLAVHELRHIAQFDEITGQHIWPLAEEIQFAYIGLSTPIWFLEGDAVGTETRLTRAGRGRQAEWIMPFRTLLLEGRNLSYQKAYFGSEKDAVPDYYRLGYLLSAQLRKDYGATAAATILSDIRQKPLRPYPFSQSLKKITGRNTRQWYLYTMAELKKQWAKQDSLNDSEKYTRISPATRIASNYLLPQVETDSTLLCLKQSKAMPATLIRFNTRTQQEEKLLGIGYQQQAWLSYARNWVLWDETRFDPRYKQRSYNVLCMYNTETGKKKQLTFKTRIFAPALSADARKIIAVQIDLSNQAHLVEIDPETGAIVQTFANPEQDLLQQPAWNADGTALCWLSVSEKGKALWWQKAGQAAQKIIKETQQQLSRPQFNGDNIVFNADLSGLDNIYEINPRSGEISALSASKYGAFNASFSANGKEMLFNDYHASGYAISSAPLTRRAVPENHFVYLAGSGVQTRSGETAAQVQDVGTPVQAQDVGTPAPVQDVGTSAQSSEALAQSSLFDSIPNQALPSQPYRPLAHLFNFHSLVPQVNDIEQPGLQVRSTDLLSTTEAYGGVYYQSALQQLGFEAGISYKALYPILNLRYTDQAATTFYKKGPDIRQANWRENRLKASLALPLSVTRFNHSYLFSAEVSTSLTHRNLSAFDAQSIRRDLRFPMQYAISFTHVLRAAERDIHPPFAQTFSLEYTHQPFDSKLKGSLWAFQSAFYFPGLATNHSFSFAFNYQQTSGVWRSQTAIPTVYGYEQIKARAVLRNTLLFQYRFPLAFPDAEIGSLAYIRNLRGGFFCHYENIGSKSKLLEPKTFGLELRSSMNLLRYAPLVDTGIRFIFVHKNYHQNPILAWIFNYSF